MCAHARVAESASGGEQNLDDEEFFGSISVPLKKFFLINQVLKNHQNKQWITQYDD